MLLHLTTGQGIAATPVVAASTCPGSEVYQHVTLVQQGVLAATVSLLVVDTLGLSYISSWRGR